MITRVGPSTCYLCTTAALFTTTFTGVLMTSATQRRELTYWKKLIISHRFSGLTITTLTYYSTSRSGPIMSEELVDGKMKQYLLAPCGMSGLFWDETAKKASLGFFSIVKLVKRRSHEVGYGTVKMLSGWPKGIHPFTFSPNFKPPRPPRYYPSKVASAISRLKNVGNTVFEGHKCLILQHKAKDLGNSGKMICRFWLDIRTHFIWKVEETIYPPANSPRPPSRDTTYVLWVKHMKRPPVEVFRFPAGTTVIVPGILGNLDVPPGGIKMKPPHGINQYLGVDMNPQIRDL